MQSETKICQNCKKEFVIELEDFEFYQKIKVPPPTWCPECRMIRRMTWRNERTLYKRKCDAPGHNEEIISIYHKDSPFKVYDQKYWWSDNWDPMDYGRDYDWNKPFFEQFWELMKEMPLVSLFNSNNVNTVFANHTEESKNCYLIFAALKNENVMYATRSTFNKDSADLYIVSESELCYENIYCRNCYRLFFSSHCDNCYDSIFLFNCKNCSNCFGCVNLRNKSYYIFNRAYSKKAYKKKIKQLDIGSFKTFLNIKEDFKQLILKYPRKYANLIRTSNVIGDNVEDAKNCFNCFNLNNRNSTIENCKFLEWGGFGLKDSYDCIGDGLGAKLHYEIIAGLNGSKNFFGHLSHYNREVFYVINCKFSSHLFGCIGLRHKQYCILNKQYTKEEYEKLLPKIIEHMNKIPYIDKKGRIYKYGEFFPPELSPFCYNETIAQEYFPLTKEKALNKGFKWKELKERNIKPDLKTEELPDHIKDVKDDILEKTIQCAHAKLKEDGTLKTTCNEQCTTAFRIIPQELEFYKKMNLPLPRYCPNCRHYQRIKQRNPLKLWKRKCMCGGLTSTNKIYKNTREHFHGKDPCPNTFETTYAPERKEIVYCEKCYLAEIV
jgi:hypothetical protein